MSGLVGMPLSFVLSAALISPAALVVAAALGMVTVCSSNAVRCPVAFTVPDSALKVLPNPGVWLAVSPLLPAVTPLLA